MKKFVIEITYCNFIMMGTERRKILIKFVCVCRKAIVTKPKSEKSRNIKPRKIRIEKPRKSGNDRQINLYHLAVGVCDVYW